MQIETFYKSRKNKITEIIIGLFLVAIPLKLALTQYKNKAYFPVIFFVILIVFGLLLFLRNMRSKKTLLLNEQGIVCRTNAIGLVEWKYIEGVEIVKASQSRILVFKITNTEELLSQKNKAVGLLMRSNIKPLGSPVVIAENEFDQSLDDVILKIEAFRKNLNS
ncbi:MAG: hypothetical protein RLZ33_3149 [Bacteroidota bacterium]|jgi:hypothetical protein